MTITQQLFRASDLSGRPRRLFGAFEDGSIILLESQSSMSWRK
tara:strand:- start:1242 stop:1370 length:129 start_codon:yes stop_codon:yes gene_type:complete